MEEDRKGVFNRLHYRLDLERLREVMFPELDTPTDEDPVPEDQTLNHDFTVQDSSSIECWVSTVQSAGISPSHYKEYAKKTSKNPPGGATLHRQGNLRIKSKYPPRLRHLHLKAITSGIRQQGNWRRS